MAKRLILLLLAIILSACGQGKPFKPTPVSEIPDGPGLFSGEDGEFVIYRKNYRENKNLQ